MIRFSLLVAFVGFLFASFSSLCAESISGSVVDESGKPMEGVMISAFDDSRRVNVSVFSQADGTFRIDGLRKHTFKLRARLAGQIDEWQGDISSGTTGVGFKMSPAEGEDLEAQRPASSAFGMLEWENERDKKNFKMMCSYCHQIGTPGFRTPEEPVDWETMIRRMDGFGGLYRHTQKTIVQRLVETYKDDAVSKWPEYVPPSLPKGISTKAKITEWDMGEVNRVMVHDLELGPDGLVYSVDMVTNAIRTLDPKTGERKSYRFPGRYRGPHSIELGNDGHMWCTLCISGEMAKFDIKTKEFTICSSAEKPARRGSYPHTLRIDPQDPEGLIWYTDAGRNSCFSLHPKTLEVKEYKLLRANQVRAGGKGESRGITPYGIDIAPDGKVWYSKLNGNRIGVIDPKVEGGDIKEWNPPFRGPRRLHVDDTGIVWVPGFGSGVFGKFDPKTEKWKVYELPDAENQIPYALNIDPKGYVWICGSGNDTMQRFDPKTEELAEFRMPSHVTYSREIEFDGEGNVWTCNSNAPARHIERGVGSIIKLELVEGKTTLATVVSKGGGDSETAKTGGAVKPSPGTSDTEKKSPAGTSGGAVRGVVRYVGKNKLERRPIRLNLRSEPAKACHDLIGGNPLSEEVILGKAGELANAFVWVKKGLPKRKKWPVPEEKAVLDQKGCRYVPRVQGVRVGQIFELRNSDMLLHNSRGFLRRNRQFNVGQPSGSKPRERKFRRAEIGAMVTCDVHPWMKAYFHVVDHPFFAVTGVDGKFELTGLPAGEYSVGVWHESFGEKSAKIEVSESGRVDLDFAFEEKKD